MGGVGWWYQLTSAWRTVDTDIEHRTVQDTPFRRKLTNTD